MIWGVVIDGRLAHLGAFGVRDRASQAPITAVLVVEFAARYYRFVYDALNASYVFAQSLKPEDWIAVIVFNHLFSGADAYVAANLWDFSANIGVVAAPGSAGVYASLRLR